MDRRMEAQTDRHTDKRTQTDGQRSVEAQTDR